MTMTCTFGFIWFITASSGASQKAGVEMNNLYLRELTTQTIGNFQASINGQFSQLKTSASSIKKEDLENLGTLTEYLKRTQENNHFDFFALVDENGRYYCAEGVFPRLQQPNLIVITQCSRRDLCHSRQLFNRIFHILLLLSHIIDVDAA